MKKKLLILLVVVLAVLAYGLRWYSTTDHERYVKVKEESLDQFTYNGPGSYLLVLIPTFTNEQMENIKPGDRNTYIAPVDSLKDKPKVAYPTDGEYDYAYNNLYKSKKSEIQLYDYKQKKTKTLTAGSFENGPVTIKEENKEIEGFKDDRIIGITGATSTEITKANLNVDFNYYVTIGELDYEVVDAVSLSDYYQKQN